MYNRYIPDREEAVPVGGPDPSPAGPAGGRAGAGGLLAGLLGQGDGEARRLRQGLTSLLKALHLERLDTGDLLLGLIVLFLVLEDGDDLDVVITLALTILLSLGER